MKYLILILLIVSCKPKQIVVTNTIRDTINIETIKRIQVPVERIITIENPCDSLGILKDFKQTIVTDKVKVTISSKNNVIYAEVNIDSIKEVWVKEYQGKTKVIVKEIEKEVPKPFIPKFVWWVIGGFILSLVWNFKRFIPFLKFLPF